MHPSTDAVAIGDVDDTLASAEQLLLELLNRARMDGKRFLERRFMADGPLLL
jgi:hypothetical protein